MSASTLKCRHCKKRKPRESMLKVPLGAFCDTYCASQYAIAKTTKEREKAERQRAREEKRQSKELKRQAYQVKQKRLGSNLSHQIDLTQQAFNAMIRELDKHLPCVSCDKPAGQYNLTAGHYQTVGAHPELRFDARNCHAQCSGCNSGVQRFAKGDRASTRQKFTATLVERYGQAFVEEITGPHPPAKYSCDELKLMRAEFHAERRRLERGEGPSRDWRGREANVKAA